MRESNLILFQIFKNFPRTLSESQFVLSAFSVGIAKVLSGKLLEDKCQNSKGKSGQTLGDLLD